MASLVRSIETRFFNVPGTAVVNKNSGKQGVIAARQKKNGKWPVKVLGRDDLTFLDQEELCLHPTPEDTVVLDLFVPVINNDPASYCFAKMVVDRVQPAAGEGREDWLLAVFAMARSVVMKAKSVIAEQRQKHPGVYTDIYNHLETKLAGVIHLKDRNETPSVGCLKALPELTSDMIGAVYPGCMHTEICEDKTYYGLQFAQGKQQLLLQRETFVIPCLN